MLSAVAPEVLSSWPVRHPAPDCRGGALVVDLRDGAVGLVRSRGAQGPLDPFYGRWLSVLWLAGGGCFSGVSSLVLVTDLTLPPPAWEALARLGGW